MLKSITLINSPFFRLKPYSTQGYGLNESSETEVVLFASKMERLSPTFPLPVWVNVKKSFFFLWAFYTEIAIFSCLLTTLPPPCVSATMRREKHPIGAPQSGSSRIVLDIFRFHQSKWLRFSIKMLNLGAGLRELGRKCDAVSIDDKWPSFDWINRDTCLSKFHTCSPPFWQKNNELTLLLRSLCIWVVDKVRVFPRHVFKVWLIKLLKPDQLFSTTVMH